MFETLKPSPPDKIIELLEMFRADPRTEKLDLGVGVYKDANGKTPVMRAVKAAEKRLLDTQDSKSYVGILGDLEFVKLLGELALGSSVPADRIAGAQTPGGTGAIRQILELIKRSNPAATVWYSDPTWPNHPAMLAHLGIPSRTYRYFDAATGGVDFAAMMADLVAMKPGDVLLLHGCCHNPTGANLTLEQWAEVTDFVVKAGVVPFIDLAYQGFGDGLEADAAGVRHMAAAVPEMLLAVSCSKNFGLYRDRVGAAIAISETAEKSAITKANLASLSRLNFSFPPDHGAKVVALILSDPALKADWQAELESMRAGMLELRKGLANELRRATNSDRFDFVGTHRGMFSRLGLSPEQVVKLREDFGIYAVGDSRINIAGLPAQGLGKLAAAIASVES
ncbi:aromatic-amino-acid transaminase [Amaricoccus macauensis]|uniref:Aminotransferase n=1 Tax=Amaricoccus macauensis TaxID=57001 RepID=A0A840STK3_9RHOB|nr:amino acid aminotransferase [Amaricoccus macauensis]MBB5222633.1 aromatic-amino-acid transaminase [Amaricoccus macauensis]